MVTTAPSSNNGLWVAGGRDYIDDAPKLDDVLSLLENSRSYFRGFHGNCETEEIYYDGRLDISVPEGFPATVPATAHAIINIATDHVDVENPTFDVPPASPRARARAERLKKFYQGVWLSIKQPVLRSAVRHAFLYGVSFAKVMWHADRWPDAPVRDDFGNDDDYKEALSDFMDERAIAFPFDIVNVNPKNLVWDDDRIGMKWAIEFYQRNAVDIRKQFPQWVSSTPAGQGMVSWAEYWDTEWVGYIADNQWVWGPHRHGYGFLPYVLINPANSADYQVGAPHSRFQGILRPIHSLLNSEARLVNAYEAILRQYGWRTIDIFGTNKQAIKETADSYELFGAINEMAPGTEARVSPNAAPPPEILQQLSSVQTMIEEATFPNVIRGVRPRGVSSGFGISVLSGMGRLIFRGVAKALGTAAEEVNSRLALLVQNKAGGKVTVHGRSEVHNFDQTIGPEDVRGYTENRVVFKAEAPEEREREAQLALQLHSGGIISLYEAQRRAGITNPLEEQMQIGAEQILNSPEIMQQKNMIAAERLGLLQQLTQAVSPGGQEIPGGAHNAGQYQPGLSQLQRPGEADIQRRRVQTRNQQIGSVFPEGFGGVDALGATLGTGGGGAQRVPSGQTVR